jgi:hypothetical protein
MHGPTAATPGELAARSLLFFAHMCLLCITEVLEPVQTRHHADHIAHGTSGAVTNFSFIDEHEL